MKTQLLTVALVAATTLFSQSQSILQDYINKGIQSNLQLKQERLNYEKSVEGLNVARAMFLPQVALNASYTLATGGRKIQFPIGDLLNPVYSTLNTLTDSDQFPQLENQNIQFLPNNFHDTKVRVIQPLFNPDIYFNYKAQKEMITVQQAQRNAYENDLRFTITAAYFQYLQASEAIRVVDESGELLKELVKLNQKLVANQKATRDVVLSAEYELSKVEQQYAEAFKNKQVAMSYFNFLLNRTLNEDIVVDTTLASLTINRYELGTLTTEALSQRSEIKQAQGGVAAAGNILSLNRATSMLPKVNLVGDIGYQGFEYKFNGDQQYALVQFSLSWDLFRGGERKARTQQARLDYESAETRMEQLRRQIELQVIQTHYEYQAALQAYTTARSGVRSAEKNFQIVSARYNEGQAIMLEYLDAQNKWTSARLMESIRLYDLLRAEAGIQKATSSI